jgi:hypothetical protein
MTMGHGVRRNPALLAGVIILFLLLAAGVAVGAVPRLVDSDAGRAAAVAADEGAPAATAAPEPTPELAPEPPDPTTTVVVPQAEQDASATAPPAGGDEPSSDDPPAATPDPEPAAAAPPPPPPAPPAPPKLPPGQRLAPSSAQVQAAIAQLHQRIPLFNPNEAQLRTFADAVCTSFDQGQSQAQVESTVRQAVSHIQGQSLSPADAAFAVSTVVQLRCPRYLP